jgi:hypothetical protein
MITSQQVIKIKDSTEVMSGFQDLNMVANILDFVKPKNVIELGAGAGGWIVMMNVLLANNNITWYGYENFSVNFNQPHWPKNSEDLQNLIITQSKNLGSSNDKIIIRNENIKQIDVEFLQSLNIKFDVVRLDCLHESMYQVIDVLHRILPFTSPHCIFLIDDIVPNIAINRLLGVMELVKEGILKPLWLGHKEGAFCKTDNLISGDLLEYLILLKNDDKLYQYRLQEINLFNNKQLYIRTI